MLEQLPTPSLSEMYPGAADAVTLHEQMKILDIYIEFSRKNGIQFLSPQIVLMVLKGSATQAVALFPGSIMHKLRIRQQMDHIDFMKYIKAKLGAV